MKTAKTCWTALLCLSLGALGCNGSSDTPADTSTTTTTTTPHDATTTTGTTTTDEAAPHVHGSGPNGGVIFDLGKYHAEFTVDHPSKQCTVLFIDGDQADAKPLPVAATELTLTTKETKTDADGTVVPPMTITLTPTDAADGKAATFVGTDPGIGNVADFAGTVTGEIDGQPSQGEFAE